MDRPDEMILAIWNKLDNIEVLYLFVGVNKRFDKLVRDSTYTCSIQLATTNSKTNKYCSLPDSILDRYCSDILPRLNHHIECLILESISMERILLSGDYSCLQKLTFTKISEDNRTKTF
ncbi:unnamed protein product [Rotaria magnacalcarata]|uniref:F-box domain-containing protein n=1 Tax=Rotaria magnacalcarata TaxID=392030 RepID=A0A816EHT4_9BILA|nr:unnamed protein product [Rotaria magnacalcarata]CAF1650390.1 unnamed protein product [Rotaria magnacalcarata]CAF2066553.1 unnamed protein product [Rotaria magnacalcarata]CAF4452021.1 unnamed protein product [Rotaria magnacalcarata]CAF4640517.1 unnamed protein product [Rotaria magnacalcarata]